MAAAGLEAMEGAQEVSPTMVGLAAAVGAAVLSQAAGTLAIP
jgi:hypothetical protein